MTLRVGILVFDDVEVLDFAGPYEVFTTASRVQGRRAPGTPAPFETFTVAKAKRVVRARAGLEVPPERTFGDAPPIDVLVVPGGVVDRELEDPAVSAWIAGAAASATITASVCTGAFLLAKAGLLEGRRATTHWEDLEDLRRTFPSVRVSGEHRWIDEGGIVTSAGISAGIDMSLHLVARLAGRDLAVATARQMDYRWIEEG